jgi:hypothetical protein
MPTPVALMRIFSVVPMVIPTVLALGLNNPVAAL